MIFFELRKLPITTIIQVYIVQGFIFGYFLFMAYKVLQRNNQRMNKIFCSFYISVAIGFFLNFIFVLFTEEFLIWAFYLATMYFIIFGWIFITIFTTTLRSINFTKKKQNIVIAGYAVLLCGIFLIPNGLKISKETDWHPVYSDYLWIFFLIVLTIAYLPALINSLIILNRFKDAELKKRWKYFVLGMVIGGIYGYTTLIMYKITL